LRAIAFLSSKETNAAAAFSRLNTKREREVRDRFDYWIDGFHKDAYFHGWVNNPKYKNCWVFKWKDKRIDQRLYGFLWHPLPKLNPHFPLCVLCFHDQKTERATSDWILQRLVALRAKPEVKIAIAVAFPDAGGGKQGWTN
jgi:hypothetical protein